MYTFQFFHEGAVILALIEGVIIGLNRAAAEQYKPGKHALLSLYDVSFAHQLLFQ